MQTYDIVKRVYRQRYYPDYYEGVFELKRRSDPILTEKLPEIEAIVQKRHQNSIEE